MKSYLLLILLINFDSVLNQEKKADPDQYATTMEIVKNRGYPIEEHKVNTKDGYVLVLHRIPHGKHQSTNNNRTKIKSVVFLQHGLLQSSITWVINFPNQSLGYILADAGYDVWMGNVRGNSYSKKHVKFNITQEAFWNFSWSEMAKYDLPTMINYVLKSTKQRQLNYIGHSQGTLIMFTELSKNKKLSSQIKLFIALAPVAYLSKIQSSIKLFAQLGIESKQLFWYDIFGKKDILPTSSVFQWMTDSFCAHENIDKIFCKNFIFLFSGPCYNLNETRLAVYVSSEKLGTSVKNLVHYGQCFMSGKLQMYDHGSDRENHKEYRSHSPPVYDLTQIKTPIALFSSKNDWLATKSDVNILRSKLSNVVDDYIIEDWGHLDFLWAMNTKKLLYDRIISLLIKNE